MAVAAGAPDTVAYAAGGDEALLRKLAARPGVRPEGVARAILHVQEAQEMAGGNVNPQLILADLLGGIRRALA